MTTTIHFVRHGAHDRLDHMLCGRMPGVSLGTSGQAQALALAAQFKGRAVAAIYSSPLERARETAGPIAAALGLPVQVDHDLIEIDVGAWSGKSFEELRPDPAWTLWNSQRALARPPGGETMLDVQARAMRAVERVRAEHPDQAVMIVTHSEIIKLALAYHLGLPVDAYARFEIDPASVSVLAVGEWGSKVHGLNDISAHKETAR